MTANPPEVEIRRSARRRRTVQARVEDGRIVVLVPDRLSPAREAELVADLVARLQARRQAGRGHRAEADLERRAAALSRAYLGGVAVPTSVRWVTNQRQRWGSCTPSTGAIRLSHRLQGMPAYVVDYVLLHELAHLIERNHSPRFWRLLQPYESLERAQAYLDGAAFAAGWAPDDEGGETNDGPGETS